MMPRVVRTATSAQAIMKTESARSTAWRARNCGARRARAKKSPSSMSAMAQVKSATCAIDCQRTSRCAAASISGVGSEKARPAARLWISERISDCCAAEVPAVTCSGRLAQQQAVDHAALQQEPEDHEDERRHADPDGDEGAVVARQRVQLPGPGRDEAGAR